MTGRLLGIGVGPGAPDLLTLRAARLIEGASVIAFPALQGAPSLARSIVADLIPARCEEIEIVVPMTPERAPAQAAYDEGAVRISQHLEAGRDVVCLCEGDPLFYGSFMYLLGRLRDRFEAEIVPGVTSLTACAASVAQPLGARNDVLSVIPGPLPDAELARQIDGAETAVIIKVGRHLARIRAVIDRLGLTDKATLVERASTDQERRLPLAEADGGAPYFSTIIITKGTDPWL